MRTGLCDGPRSPAARNPQSPYGAQRLRQLLPNAGLISPKMSMVLPHRLIGMEFGTWMTLPERTPGELVAPPAAEAPSVALAIPAGPSTAMPATADRTT